MTVEEVNETLEDEPQLVNEDPYGKGWIAKVTLSGAVNDADFLGAADYRALIGK